MNMLSEHWEIIIGGVVSILAFIGGKGKRKYDSLSTMQDTYDKFVQNFQQKYTELENDLHQIKEQVAFLEGENKKLHDEVNRWKKLYESLLKK